MLRCMENDVRGAVFLFNARTASQIDIGQSQKQQVAGCFSL
jgi:hypothetical protein